MGKQGMVVAKRVWAFAVAGIFASGLAVGLVGQRLQAQEIIIDPNVPGLNGTALRSSGGGNPQIDIATPDSGVSHNKFQRYNVGPNGLILNNSATGGTSSIGGSVNANSNLSTSGSASVILNEVTGTGSSSLTGITEVFGGKASVIIANPNGVGCNGCSFINTHRSTLTTGVPTVTGSQIGLRATGGTVSVGTGGFTSEGAADLVGRHVTIGGPVNADTTLTISGGAQEFNYNAGTSQAAPTTKARLTPFAVDAATLGALTAGTIRIHGNENGLGVNAYGNIASGGNLNLSSKGDIHYGDVQSTGSGQVDAQGSVRQYGNAQFDGNVSISGNDFTLYRDRTLSAGGNVTINTDDFAVVIGEISGTNVTINADGVFTNNGFVFADEDLVVVAGDEVNNQREVATEYDANLEPALKQYIEAYQQQLLNGGPEADFAAEMLRRARLNEVLDEYVLKGAAFGAENIDVTAELDIVNTGGAIAATNNVTLESVTGSIINQYQATRHRIDDDENVGCKQESCGYRREFHVGEILAGGDLTLTAELDVRNLGSDIAAAGSINIGAGRDVINALTSEGYIVDGAKTFVTEGRFPGGYERDCESSKNGTRCSKRWVAPHDYTESETYNSHEQEFALVSSRIATLNGDITLVAGHDFSSIGSRISAGGDLSIGAGNDALFTSFSELEDDYLFRKERHKYSTTCGKDGGSCTRTRTVDVRLDDYKLRTSLSDLVARNIIVNANRNITVSGGRFLAQVDLSLEAATGSILIDSADLPQGAVLPDYDPETAGRFVELGQIFVEGSSQANASAATILGDTDTTAAYSTYIANADLLTAVDALKKASGGFTIRTAARSVGVQSFNSLFDDVDNDAAIGLANADLLVAYTNAEAARAKQLVDAAEYQQSVQTQIADLRSRLGLTQAEVDAAIQSELAPITQAHKVELAKNEAHYQRTLETLQGMNGPRVADAQRKYDSRLADIQKALNEKKAKKAEKDAKALKERDKGLRDAGGKAAEIAKVEAEYQKTLREFETKYGGRVTTHQGYLDNFDVGKGKNEFESLEREKARKLDLDAKARTYRDTRRRNKITTYNLLVSETTETVTASTLRSRLGLTQAEVDAAFQNKLAPITQAHKVELAKNEVQYQRTLETLQGMNGPRVADAQRKYDSKLADIQKGLNEKKAEKAETDAKALKERDKGLRDAGGKAAEIAKVEAEYQKKLLESEKKYGGEVTTHQGYLDNFDVGKGKNEFESLESAKARKLDLDAKAGIYRDARRRNEITTYNLLVTETTKTVTASILRSRQGPTQAEIDDVFQRELAPITQARDAKLATIEATYQAALLASKNEYDKKTKSPGRNAGFGFFRQRVQKSPVKAKADQAKADADARTQEEADRRREITAYNLLYVETAALVERSHDPSYINLAVAQLRTDLTTQQDEFDTRTAQTFEASNAAIVDAAATVAKLMKFEAQLASVSHLAVAKDTAGTSVGYESLAQGLNTEFDTSGSQRDDLIAATDWRFATDGGLKGLSLTNRSVVYGGGNVNIKSGLDIYLAGATTVSSGDDLSLVAGRRIGALAAVNSEFRLNDTAYKAFTQIGERLQEGTLLRDAYAVEADALSEEHLGELRETDANFATATANYSLAPLTVISGGGLTLSAGEDVLNFAGSFASGDELIVTAERDIRNEGLRNNFTLTKEDGCVSRACGGQGHDYRAGEILSGSTALLSAGRDIRVYGGVVSAAASVLAQAEGDIEVDAITSQFLYYYSKSSKFLGLNKKKKKLYRAIIQEGEFSTLFGNISLTAGADLNITGSRVLAGGDVYLEAGNDINLLAKSEEVHNYYKKSGFGFLYYASDTVRYNEFATALAQIQGQNVAAYATNNLTGIGAAVFAADDIALSAENNVTFDAHQNVRYVIQSGWSLGVSFAGSNILKAAFESNGDALAILEAYVGENPTLAAVHRLATSKGKWDTINGVIALGYALPQFGAKVNQGAGARNPGESLASSLAQELNPFADFAEFSLDPSSKAFLNGVTFRLGAYESRKEWTESHVSYVIAGRDLTIGAGKDLVLSGGTIASAGRDNTLVAGNDLLITALADWEKSSNSNWGVSLGYTTDGWTIGADYAQSQASAQLYTNAAVTAGRLLTMVAGQDMTIAGADIHAGLSEDEVRAQPATGSVSSDNNATVDADALANGEWVSSTGNGSWWKADYGEGSTPEVHTYSITAVGDYFADGSPSRWVLQGSNEDGTWVDLDVVDSQIGWTAGEKRTFTIDTPGSYRQYRLSDTYAQTNGHLVRTAAIDLKTEDYTGEIYMDVGRDLVVASKQNTSESNSFGFSFSISESGAFSLNANYSYSDRRYTDTPTIIEAEDRLDIYVGGKTYLLGSALNSRTNNLRLDTGDFLFDNYRDSDTAVSVGVSVGSSANHDLDGGFKASYSDKQGITFATVGQGDINIRNNAKQNLNALNRTMADLQRITSKTDFAIEIPGLNFAKLAADIEATANLLRAAGTNIADTYKVHGAQAIDLIEDAILLGATPEQLRAYIQTQDFRAHLTLRQVYSQLSEAPDVDPELKAFVLYSIFQGEQVYFDPDDGEFKIPGDCGLAFFSSPCGIDLKLLKQKAEFDVAGYSQNVLSLIDKWALRANGTGGDPRLQIQYAIACGLAWTMLTGDTQFINYALEKTSSFANNDHRKLYVAIVDHALGDGLSDGGTVPNLELSQISQTFSDAESWANQLTIGIAVGDIIEAVAGSRLLTRHLGSKVNSIKAGIDDLKNVIRTQNEFAGKHIKLGGRATNTGAAPRTTAQTQDLRGNMQREGMRFDSGEEAHHIVAKNDGRAAEARDLLAEAGVDLNSPANGVPLPGIRTTPNPNNKALHRGDVIHSQGYYDYVNTELRNVSPEQRPAVVRRIADELDRGEINW